MSDDKKKTGKEHHVALPTIFNAEFVELALENLPQRFRQNVSDNLLIFADGIFLFHNKLSSIGYAIIKIVEKHLPPEIHNQFTIEEVKQTLRNLSYQTQYYFQLDEQLCVGYFIRCKTGKKIRGLYQFCQGRVISAGNFIHAKDPDIVRSPNISIACSLFCTARVKLWQTETWISIDQHAFRQFISRTQMCETFNSIFRDTLHRQALYLLALIKMLKESVPAQRKNRTCQIIRHDFRPAEYRIWHDWIFVIEDNVLKTCYVKQGACEKLYQPLPKQAVN
ncbi:hypothetical protein A2533_03080 [Candidatus Falkowbacteria bacterium RIFOXYD2_FULL_35_9]|uniref:Uncharacterized protein n=1 Tax=Candidatus Falkowbacteria bacterium RIFOXYC2_FULL_36_12 TaxID=1798002 RepID=A0A1F5SWR2_9BACT|nr:MAG: hypothetical protein A2478_00375 [Candidatus Falkowbacteria bacterium RIFOXYC2_FULL_36_12]OGF31556.1 MAG: hypothetical protein A2300_03695 [Candidatus Falkowbacteria bacterium RIFOXYB2_FULL_35_7]OGF33595.1 MAG: hypothetical protein A2223_03510 [Candidatus Falkowbacteria bacterium RIFOXYA2_FULL_35_8]OGF46956.1 MAG: hypothetical protein A2533_03080 [Candidatus Falkowbacteria bacterium RIFOXYD2_FULL_35_9]